ncbi:hypothetical protein pb186bvf_002168 [Paramecium bursaria]
MQIADTFKKDETKGSCNQCLYDNLQYKKVRCSEHLRYLIKLRGRSTHIIQNPLQIFHSLRSLGQNPTKEELQNWSKRADSDGYEKVGRLIKIQYRGLRIDGAFKILDLINMKGTIK